MPAYEGSDDVPTLRELARTLSDFREEFRLQTGQMVRKDVHTVEHDAMTAKYQAACDRITKLEAMRVEDDKQKVSNRNAVYLCVLGSSLSLLVGIILAVVK